MIVRCKAFVANLIAEETGRTTVHLKLAYSQTPGTENYQFHSSSPSGNIKLTLWTPKAGEPNQAHEFTPGSWWYIDTERVEEILEANAGAYCWLAGIERQNGYRLEGGKLVRSPGNSLRSKTSGVFNNMTFESDIYIANEAVYDQFDEIGVLYKLSFTATTKEGT